MLKLVYISKQYDGVRAVDRVSFQVKRGDIYGFLGPNGAGKTTTIRMIMGIIQPDSGSIEIIDNNKTGLLAPKDDSIEFSKAIV